MKISYYLLNYSKTHLPESVLLTMVYLMPIQLMVRLYVLISRVLRPPFLH